MDPSALQNMDRDALKKQIENMKYQASMERWPLSKSIAEWVKLMPRILAKYFKHQIVNVVEKS